MLMLSRVILGTSVPLANNDHLVGAMIFTFAVMAMAEVGRMLRFVNVAFGLWLMIAPWLLAGATPGARVGETVIGAGVLVLCLPRGRRSDAHYGGWDRFVM